MNMQRHVAVLVLLTVCSSVCAQDAVRDFTNWFPFGTAPPIGAYPIVTGPGATAGSHAFTDGSTRQRLTVQQWPTLPTFGNLTLSTGRDITVAGWRPAGAPDPDLNVYLVTHLLGQIDQNAGGTVGLSYQANLRRWDGAAYQPVAGMSAALNVAVAGAVDRTLVKRKVVKGGSYRVVADTTLAAVTDPGLLGSTNDLDFYSQLNAGTTTEQNRGILTGLAVSPRGLPNTRDAIGVARAHADQWLRVQGFVGATGRDVKLGQLELYRPMTTHTHMPAAALEIDPKGNDAFWRSEHATGVAGIMVGRSATAEQRGVAPDAKLFSSAFCAQDGATDDQKILNSMDWLVDQKGVAVVNASFGVATSAGDGSTQMALLYDWVVEKKRKLMVLAAGNKGGTGTVVPGQQGYRNVAIGDVPSSIMGHNGGYNGITVGALDWDCKARAYYSSYGPTRDPAGRVKPDIMAPGTFILTTVQTDLDGDGNQDDYERVFFGSDNLKRPTNRQYRIGSDMSGTSFAAPHVAGALGMMLEFARFKDGAPDGDRSDPRIIKAAIMNSANRDIKHRDGSPWAQVADPADPRFVTRPLDNELGAGMLALDKAMSQIHPPETRGADNIVDENKLTRIDAGWTGWDLQQIAKRTKQSRIIRYKFGRAFVKGQKFRATLAWNRKIASTDGNLDIESTDTFTAGNLNDLDLKLYRGGTAAEKKAGGAPYKLQLASESPSDNVELIHDFEIVRNGVHYLDVWNLTNAADEYGAVWSVTGNPAAAAGRRGAPKGRERLDDDEGLLLEDPLEVEANYNALIKATFDKDELINDEDSLSILDDNFSHVYEEGTQYDIFWGHEYRDDSADPLTDVNWYDESMTISLDSLVAGYDWQELLSTAADSDGNLPPTLIGDSGFLTSLAALPDSAFPIEYNFVIDVDGDGLFTQALDGVGWFEIVPEPSSLTLVAVVGLLVTLRRRG